MLWELELRYFHVRALEGRLQVFSDKDGLVFFFFTLKKKPLSQLRKISPFRKAERNGTKASLHLDNGLVQSDERLFRFTYLLSIPLHRSREVFSAVLKRGRCTRASSSIELEARIFGLTSTSMKEAGTRARLVFRFRRVRRA
jgi:hypothetical protein